MLALFPANADAPDVTPSSDYSRLRWIRVAWRVDPEKFDEAQNHLRECGVAFEGPIDHDGPRSIYFADPDSHPLEITCYPK